jgi:small-conductance mechanosensitive channel
MTCLIEDNRKIISHYMFITCGRPDGDLVERDPAFRVFLVVVLPELFKLEVLWPYDLPKMRSELFETRGAVFGVVLDAAHILMGLAVISMTSDMAADVTRRKTVTKITRRVLVDLLISIAVLIAVIVMMTSTTILSALVAAATAATTAATTTTWRIGWRRIVTMLVTWMF